MKENHVVYSQIPTNIITGFLGVGKTSTILNLLKNKPAKERWAVLVNEFGEIGVDGSLFQGAHTEDSGVYITEVPGGCMCCAAGLPMQIALNQLIARAKPDRLLIEPTGLGHPKEVLQVLNEPHYRQVLDIQKTITLIDARKLQNERYTRHVTFNQQIEVADIVVGNKVDLYDLGDKDVLSRYVEKLNGPGSVVVFASHGALDPKLLNGPSQSLAKDCHHHHHHHSEDIAPMAQNAEIPECGYLQVENSGEGYQSIGWRFSPEIVFKFDELFSWLNGLEVERLKAVFITDFGIFGFNLSDGVLTQSELDEVYESRIEIIAEKIDSAWEEVLLSLAQSEPSQ